MAGAIRVKGSETGFTELRANENATDNVIILPTDSVTVASEEYVQLQLDGLELGDLANVDVDAAGENDLLAFDGEDWIATSEPVVDKVSFETQSPPTLDAEGELGWDDLDRALAYRTNDTIIDIGQENVVLIRNNTGSQLDKGSSVCVVGAAAQRISVVKSDASPGLQGCRTIGVTLEDIPNNSFGLVSTFGMVRGIDTNGFDEGDELFISTTPGVLTNIPPASPARRVTVGYVVIKGVGNGAIFVTIRRGLWLREVDDVNAESPTDGQVLSYNNSAGVWNPTSLSTTDISEGTNLYYTDARVDSRTATNRAPLYFVENVRTANYTLALSDVAKVVAFNSTSNLTLTVPTNTSVAFPIGTVINVYRAGTGSVTISGASGTTVRNAGNIPDQFVEVSLRKRGANEWVLSGDII
jgi:hypothetical protein